MAWAWFICCIFIWIYAASKKKGLNHYKSEYQKLKSREDNVLKDFEAAAAKLVAAKERNEEAIGREKYAAKVREAAAETVKKTKEENRLLNHAIEEITNLWVNDSFKNISDKLTSENFSTQKSRLEKVFEHCEKLGLSFLPKQTVAFFDRLKTDWLEEVKSQKAKDEQIRIRELMREEQRAEKEKQAELKRIEQEKKALEAKKIETEERLKILRELEVLKQLTDAQKQELQDVSTENADLLVQIEEKERSKSMAELTRAGHVYVISNVGSFGENTYKVGMTRRLIPEDRIKELGDASVPFPFDVHMMIATEDAPKLESRLHEHLWNHRLNMVNDHKEFFRVDLATIKTLVDKHGGGIVYEFKEASLADQWRESEKRRLTGENGKYRKSVETPDEEEAA